MKTAAPAEQLPPKRCGVVHGWLTADQKRKLQAEAERRGSNADRLAGILLAVVVDNEWIEHLLDR